jgi:hypothetical protein
MASDGERSRSERTSAREDWASLLPVLVSVSAAILYAVTATASNKVYSTLGISPADVGLTYGETLRRAASFVVSLVPLTAAGVFIVVVATRPFTRRPVLKLLRPVTTGVVAVMLVSVAITAATFWAPETSRFIAAGFSSFGGPGLTDFSPWDARPAKVRWLVRDHGPLPAGCMLYLGTADGVAVLYDAGERFGLGLRGEPRAPYPKTPRIWRVPTAETAIEIFTTATACQPDGRVHHG